MIEDLFDWWDDALEAARARAWAEDARQKVVHGPVCGWLVVPADDRARTV